MIYNFLLRIAFSFLIIMDVLFTNDWFDWDILILLYFNENLAIYFAS
jgi:hypothetical protein